MNKIWLLILVLCKIQMPLHADVHWNNSLLPDFRFALKPFLFNENQGIACLVEKGRQIFRVSGTYGLACDHWLGKVSLEYLSQRLGLVYLSGREHKWVKQGAIGGACRFGCCDMTLNYSYAPERKIFSHVIPHKNAICDKKIAGSSAFGMGLSSFFSPWNGAEITGGLVYDYVQFKRHFERDKAIQGVGLKVGFDQCLWGLGNLHLGVNFQAPYIFYEGSISSQMNFLARPIEVALYAQKVQGFRGIPSSSRIGLEIGVNWGRFRALDFTCCPSVFEKWLALPAVYVPEVLVMKDEQEREFCLAPFAGEDIEHIVLEPGTFTLDAATYFKGTSPLIFSSSPLPENFTLNAVTGKITGVVDANLKEPCAVIIKATNYSGEAEKIMFLNFNGD